MRRKLLFVINSLAGGGAERVFATLLRGSQSYLAESDSAVVLLDQEEEAYPLPEGLRVIRLDARGSFRRSLTGLATVVARERPDIALSFLTRANIATVAAMRRLGRPAIISERVNTSAHLGKGRSALVSKALVRLAYPRAASIIAVSEGVADTLVSDFGVQRARTRVIANPVDIDRIQALAAEPAVHVAEPPYVVAMGRLVPNKNFALAIEAFAAAGHSGRLVLMGQGPEEAALRAQADRLGIGDRLIMPGFVANPYAVLARAELMLLPSNAEGFPNALVEGMAAGVPVIATDCRSGPAEVLAAAKPLKNGQISFGRGGLLVPVEDVEAMTSAIRQLAPNSARRAALAAEGLERVRDFGVAEAVRRYWSVIDEVAGSFS